MPEIRINDHKPDAPDADLEAETAAESASENEDQGDTVEQNDEPSGPVAVELDPIEKLEAEKAELLNHFQRAQA